MPCNINREAGGATIICCGRGRRRQCATPGCDADGDFLCDYPLQTRTCDRPMCNRCRTKVGPDRDYCPEHAAADAQTSLPLAEEG